MQYNRVYFSKLMGNNKSMNQEETVKKIISGNMYETLQRCVWLIREAGITEAEYADRDIAKLYEAYNEHQEQEENRTMENV